MRASGLREAWEEVLQKSRSASISTRKGKWRRVGHVGAWPPLQSRLGMGCTILGQCSALGKATQGPQGDTRLRGPEFDIGS